MTSIEQLQSQIEAMAAQLDELRAKDAIRDCIYRINRGIDRIDETLMASGFHPDAQIRWGTADHVPFAEWIKVAIQIQHMNTRVQHMIGNILIDLRGDEAFVESYEIARHLSPLPDGKKDLIIASRYVDRFLKRDGAWRIIERNKVGDWIRIMDGEDPMWDHIPLRAERDPSDISFETFGAAAFHNRT